MARVNRENRERAEKAERDGKEAEPESPLGPDGVYHVMDKEMLMSAATKDADENQEPLAPSVVHAEELRVKQQYGDFTAPIDPTPPDPEAPIDARKGDDDRAKATQYPTQSDRRGRR
jgi:hypothetical protein